MRRVWITAAVILCLLVPTISGSVPTLPEPTPENGCVFADAVLDEITKEETRIYGEIAGASLARRVVLTVQAKSGENLRKATKDWKDEHCVRS